MDDDMRINDPTQDDRNEDLDNRDDDMFHPGQQPRLAEDGAPPAAPENDIPGAKLPIDHPQTDTNIEAEGEYEMGVGNESGVNVFEEDSDTVEKAIDENQDTTGRAR